MVDQRSNDNFVPDEELIKEALKLLPPRVDPNLISVELKLDQRVGEALNEDYSCPICFLVVW